jgi:hypothetical protein
VEDTHLGKTQQYDLTKKERGNLMSLLLDWAEKMSIA